MLVFRASPKLTPDVFRKGARLYSFKFDMSRKKEAEEPSPANTAEEAEIGQTSSLRYNVNQERTSKINNKPSLVGDVIATQRHNIKAKIEAQHLQPAMLPVYFQKSMEKNALVNLNPDPNEKEKINSQTRKFQVSKTYANATLPLKAVKLASPFPDPVKMMMSRTISDEEKAMQMLADARSQKEFVEHSKGTTSAIINRTLHTGTKRWYSKIVGRQDKFEKVKAAALDCNKRISTAMKNPEDSSEDKKYFNVSLKKNKKRLGEVFFISGFTI